MKKHILPFLTVLFLLLAIGPAALCHASDYIHGPFRYTVSDNSVTITACTGREESVTVPSMIGGNPVNTIASGAFAGNKAVKEIILPDTVVSVESGAFGPGQSIIYQEADQGGKKAAGEESGPAEAGGIRMDDGSLVTTDDQGNLVFVDGRTGAERVLDDSRTYISTKGPDGQPVITGEDGSSVTVQAGRIISFTKADQTRVTATVDQTGNLSVKKADPSGGLEEEDLDLAGEEAGRGQVSADQEEAESSQSEIGQAATKDHESDRASAPGNLALLVCLILLLAAAGGWYLYSKKKKSDSSGDG